jgi:tRNA1Val (adenine37-N6)-methyltransferase
MHELIKPGERVDDLQYKGYKIIQNPDEFCFGTDAVLLANFAQIKKGSKVLDLGTGTGIIPILIEAKTDALHITGVEILPNMADMAKRSILLNKIEDKVTIINENIINAKSFLPLSSFDIITCNPPYKDKGRGSINPEDSKAIARHEIKCTLEDIISISRSLLKFGGKLCMIHRPQRLSDIICLMRKYNIEPKRIRLIYPNKSKPASLVLIEGSRSGKPELRVLGPLFVFDELGNYSEEINQIYDRGM